MSSRQVRQARAYGYQFPAYGRPKAKLIDVEILGHIFEQSITDLERIEQSSLW